METTGIVPTMPVNTNSMFGGEGIWIFALLILLFGANGSFFGGGAQNALSQSDLQRAIDLNSIQNGQRDIEARVQEVGAEAIGATKDLAYNNLGEIRDVQAAVAEGNAQSQRCCCEILRSIDGINYNNALNTASINANTTAAMQKVLDTLAQDKIEALQGKISSLELAQAMTGVVKYPLATTYANLNNPFCNSGCGCNGSF